MNSRRPIKEPLATELILKSTYQPRGDQPGAIEALDGHLRDNARFQTLLGVTGSGKTFTIANILQKQQRPALVIAPNKTLAAQLYSEFKEFFPENRVRYFVSYYDYYQPEAYVPSTDTFIEKDAAINEEIDKMRHGATRALLESRDTIVVASVSCIYGLGAPEDYYNLMLFLEVGDSMDREVVLQKLVAMQYRRASAEFSRGTFRVRGETIDIFPSDDDQRAIRLQFFGSEVEEICEIDGLTGLTTKKIKAAAVYPVSHFLTGDEKRKKAIVSIGEELKQRLPEMVREGKTIEAQRLEQRTLYDLELLQEVGICPGIENYSRHLAQRSAGDPPTTLLDYFPKDFILILDESHVTLPQIGGMYRGDQARKGTLVDYGFRLPSAKDNRPLKIEEFWERVGQTIFVSATPAEEEIEKSEGRIVEQVNRPTGLIDPPIAVRPALNQVDDVIQEIRKTTEAGNRTLVTTLTKKMSENLADYMREVGIKCRYLHSDITAIERVEILRALRRGEFDVLIGINLLREGLDLAEVALVAILDADKEGFLRSQRSLIQTMGRAARNIDGRVILYADVLTQSIKDAMKECDRRRTIQTAYNTEHGITPQTARSNAALELVPRESLENLLDVHVGGSPITVPSDPKEQQKLISDLRRQMMQAAHDRQFERAAELRDVLKKITEGLLAA